MIKKKKIKSIGDIFERIGLFIENINTHIFKKKPFIWSDGNQSRWSDFTTTKTFFFKRGGSSCQEVGFDYFGATRNDALIFHLSNHCPPA